MKLTTPVKLARRDSGARLLFTKSGSGYADKDKAKDDKWKDDDDDKPAPPKAGTGGVDVSADSGAIVARRAAPTRGRHREADERGEDRLAAAEGRAAAFG